MTTIIVTHENNTVDEFVFDDAQEKISIGRRSTNDVCIPDLSVSGNHARITRQAGVCWLEDLNSTNGTFVNGQVIQRQPVANDDDIIIGKISLSVLSAVDHETIGAARADSDTSHSADAHGSAGISSDFGDGQLEPMETLDPLAMNDAADGIEQQEPLAFDDERPAATDEVHSAHPLDDAPTRVGSAAAAAVPGSVAMAGVPATGSGASVKPASNAGSSDNQTQVLELDSAPATTSRGAVIEIKNGAKSGQILPIDKPVTTLGRPGIQIAAIMRKPDGYFLMHIESDDSVERPTLNQDAIGDEPVMLHSGDELNVAGIDVEFMLS